MKHILNWQVGFCDSKDAVPQEFFPATVPGAVQLDYMKHYNLPHYHKEKNFEEYKWMEDKFWIYTADFNAQEIKDNLFLVSKGIDYKYEIYVNDALICEYEGMYRIQKLPLENSKKLTLKIVVYPAPKSKLGYKDSRDEANQSAKPAVSYGWDFHPRLVPIGIWDEIYILETKREKIAEPKVSYTLADDLKSAQLTFNAEGFNDGGWKLFDKNGELLFEGKGDSCSYTLENLNLWWCNGYGEPYLYSWQFEAENIPFVTKKIGFKKIELIKAKGSWGEGLNYPMSRNTPPITVRLNNQVIFAKGTNWVAPEIFYGTLTYERYREQLELVKNANVNFVRCWGGAVVNKDCFFEICDELGILVWQEFPLACNRYHNTPEYVSMFKTEAAAIVERVKDHVCLMLWCGGNELFNNWSLMTEQDDAIRIMNMLTYIETPKIPFISTAPVMGMAHGPYAFVMADGKEIFEVMAESHNTAYTEFGCPAMSPVETLSQIADLDKLWPLNKENEIACAHGVHWTRHPVEKYFGEIKDLTTYIECQQMMQSTALSFTFEEARRQKPYCSIVSNWCFNEPWPNTGNHSVISYPNNPKPVYKLMTNSYRPVLASARYKKFVYLAGEFLTLDLFLLNDSLQKVADGTVKIYVKVGNEEKVHVLDWDYKNVPICENVLGPTVRYQLPYVNDADTVQIILDAGEYSSSYTLLYRLPQKPPAAPRKMNAILNENDF